MLVLLIGIIGTIYFLMKYVVFGRTQTPRTRDPEWEFTFPRRQPSIRVQAPTVGDALVKLIRDHKIDYRTVKDIIDTRTGQRAA